MDTEYIVVIENDWNGFMEEIERFLKDGWELQGGVSIAYDHEEDSSGDPFGLTYAQAVVRKHEQ